MKTDAAIVRGRLSWPCPALDIVQNAVVTGHDQRACCISSQGQSRVLHVMLGHPSCALDLSCTGADEAFLGATSVKCAADVRLTPAEFGFHDCEAAQADMCC